MAYVQLLCNFYNTSKAIVTAKTWSVWCTTPCYEMEMRIFCRVLMATIPDIVVHINQIRQGNISRQLIRALRHSFAKTLGDLRTFYKRRSLGNNVHGLLFPFLSCTNPSFVATVVKLLVTRWYVRIDHNFSLTSWSIFIVISFMVNINSFWGTNIFPPLVSCRWAIAEVFYIRTKSQEKERKKSWVQDDRILI